MALSYSTAGKYGEAMGLFDLCLKRIRTAQQHLRDCKTLNEVCFCFLLRILSIDFEMLDAGCWI